MTLLNDGQAVSIRVVAEDGFGVLPPAGTYPAPRELLADRYRLTPEAKLVGRGAISEDHATGGLMVTSFMGRGVIGGELLAGAFDEMIAAVMFGAWSSDPTFDIFSGVAVTGPHEVTVISSKPVAAYFTGGSTIKLSGFTNAENNRYARVGAITTVGPLTTIELAVSAGLGPLTVEPASAATRIHDADDVCVLNSTSIISSANTIESTSNEFDDQDFEPGQMIFIDWRAGSTFAVITSISGSTLLLSAAAPPIPAGAAVTIKASTLRNPELAAYAVQTSFYVETVFADADVVMADTGRMIDQVVISGTSGQPIKVEVTSVSKSLGPVETPALSAPDFDVLDAQNGSALYSNESSAFFGILGANIVVPVTAMSVKIAANLKPIRALGEKTPIDFQRGTLVVSGSVSILLDAATKAMLKAYTIGNPCTFSWSMNDADGRGYVVTIPTAMITNAPVAQTSPTGDVMLKVEFRAYASPGLIKIDRFTSIS